MAYHSLGTKLKLGSVEIGGLTSIGGPQTSTETIDVTTFDSISGFREHIAGLSDIEDLSLAGFFKPGNAGQTLLYDKLLSKTVETYTIEFPVAMGCSWTFQGMVIGFGTEEAVEDAVNFSATIKITGAPTLDLTYSGGLSALVLTDSAAGTPVLSPAFATGTYDYISSVANGITYVTATPTAAAHTIKVNGVTVASGVASGQIALTAGALNTIEIVAKESGAIAKTYTVNVFRAA